MQEKRILASDRDHETEEGRGYSRISEVDGTEAQGDGTIKKQSKIQTEFELFALLREEHLTMSTAESCTGGMIAARMVNVPGVSEVFTAGLVTYSNEAKMRLLGVREETLAAWGAVSRETAAEMAEGGAKANQTDLCLSTTGIAGPDGGTPQKPVGLVYMACCLGKKTKVRRYQFQGDRQSVREQAVQKALELAKQCLMENRTGLLENSEI